MTRKMGTQYKYIYTMNKEKISGLILLEPKVNYDNRGFFLESWNKRDFNYLLNKDNQEKVEFVQENHSESSKGVLRGLHFQREPFPQGKLVRCTSGQIFDVVLDLRKDSKTFCKWAGVFLSSDNLKQLWVPKGFAHGFLTLSSKAEVNYKTTDYWSKEHEMSICWDDKNINIKWPLEKIGSKVITNQKDKYAKKLSEIQEEFLF